MVEQTGTPRLTTTEMWGCLFGEQEGYLVTFVGRQARRADARPNELDDTAQRSWRYPRDREKAAEYLQRQSESGCDVYFGVHLFEQPGNRRKDNALGRVSAVWVDGDGAQVPPNWPQPNIVVESSPGRQHFYWSFSTSISPEQAALLSKRLTYGMGGDKGKWGLGTVLRVPDTYNYKREKPTLVSARLLTSEPYDPEDLDAAIPTAEEVVFSEKARHRREKGGSPTPSRASGTTAGEPPVGLAAVDLEAWHGTRTVADDDGGVDRSRTLHWIACAVARGLRRAGISEVESHRIVADAVEERDFALGYRKYTDRDDRAERYAELADESLAEAARDVPARNGSDGLPDGSGSANGNGDGGSDGGTPPRGKKPKGSGGGGSDKKPPIADRLLGYVRGEKHELFLDQVGAPHILFRGEPYPLNSVFDRQLRIVGFEWEQTSMSSDGVRQARDTLAAFAYVSDTTYELHTRAAWHEDALYYQLGKGRVMKVDASGYRLVEDAPVLFRHVSNLQPLPDPEPGGDFDVLASFINLKNTRDKRLYIVWMVVALLPHVARPIMEATGEMGAGKTVMGRMAKRLLDPSRPETVGLDKREFLQKASHAYIVMMDNLQSIPEWAVDNLCRLVTGEADSKRVLYENDEDWIYEMKRALIVNGINTPTDRGDARDRTLPIELERLKNHRPEEEMWREFYDIRPKLLGCVFDALSKALAAKPGVRLNRHARLADWSVYAASVYEGLGWGTAKFEEDWQRVVRVQNQGTLDGSGLAQAVMAFMENRQFYRDTSTDLHVKLETFAEEMSIDVRHDPRWPRSANWVWKRIKEVRPLLTALGIDTRRDTNDRRGTLIVLERIGTGNEPQRDPPGGVEGSGAENASNGGSKNPLLAQLLPHTNAAEAAGSESSASSASISGYFGGSVSRLNEEEGEKAPENGGLEGHEGGKIPTTRKVSQNTCTTSNTSTGGSGEQNPGDGGGVEDASAGGSETAAADEESLTPRERAERRRARLRNLAERDETGTV